jgi:hypothetical protein
MAWPSWYNRLLPYMQPANETRECPWNLRVTAYTSACTSAATGSDPFGMHFGMALWRPCASLVEAEARNMVSTAITARPPRRMASETHVGQESCARSASGSPYEGR